MWQRTGIDVGSSLIQIHSIPAEEFAEFTSLDNRKRVEPVNDWDSPLVFEIGESTGRDQVLSIFMSFGKALSGFKIVQC